MTVYDQIGVDMWQQDADVYVVPTNARGVFGAGVAKDFAGMFPDKLARYQRKCELGEVGGGDVHVESLGKNPYGSESYVAYFTTKVDWREPSQIAWIRAGLDVLFVIASMTFVAPRGRVAMPAIGCGLGGLDFGEVRALIMERFDPLPNIDVVLNHPRK